MKNKIQEYKLLDSGNWQKLEQVGEYRLVRPALNAAWKPSLNQSEWKNVHGIFTRNATTGKNSGKWQWLNGGTPDSWTCRWGGVNIVIKPTNFGHLGFFAEQYTNWQWQRETIQKMLKHNNEVKVLNMFAYSGCGSMAMAQAGAQVTHLDAARGMIEWGKDIQAINDDVPNNIRWITDDVQKFTAREVRRGSKYNALILDPPSFGRGANGQLWKIEQHLDPLLTNLQQLIDYNNEFFVILSCHSPGYSPIVLSRLLQDFFPQGNFITSGEMIIPQYNSENLLPAGIFSRISTI
ncbi:class I SAM-dependent methyltransferase [Lentisphaerota bacterium WC36G]|nr:class I SAM-dependent methyltransferase [Lentisphaerae bacterium WC36]